MWLRNTRSGRPSIGAGYCAAALFAPVRPLTLQRLAPVTAPAIAPIADWAWQRQSVWSQTADRLKSGPSQARRLRLALTIAGAALALASSQLKPVSTAAGGRGGGAAAVVMAAVGLLSGLQRVEQVRRWTRARSVSEALKTEVFLFLTQLRRVRRS